MPPKTNEPDPPQGDRSALGNEDEDMEEIDQIEEEDQDVDDEVSEDFDETKGQCMPSDIASSTYSQVLSVNSVSL